ncbi:hypothetical protein JCM5350_007305 [Sporobolomyces pararoseus]
MCLNETRLFYGIWVGAIDLAVAAIARSRVRRQLSTIRLVQRRFETLSLDPSSFSINRSLMFPAKVWSRIIRELVDSALEDAEDEFSKEAVSFLDGGFGMPDSFYETRMSWHEARYDLEYDWETWVEETGGVMGVFASYEQQVKALLRLYGLVLASPQEYTQEQVYNGKEAEYPLVPVSFPIPSSVSTGKTGTILLKASVDHDDDGQTTAHKVLTIDQSRLTSIPPDAPARFDHLLQFYRIDTDIDSLLVTRHKTSSAGDDGKKETRSEKAERLGIKGCITSNLSRCLAAEWAPHGIRVNNLNPGFIKTDQTNHMDANLRENQCKEVPLGRFSEVYEQAAPAVLLLSQYSSYTTGSSNYVDGGYLIW